MNELPVLTIAITMHYNELLNQHSIHYNTRKTTDHKYNTINKVYTLMKHCLEKKKKEKIFFTNFIDYFSTYLP